MPRKAGRLVKKTINQDSVWAEARRTGRFSSLDDSSPTRLIAAA